jgi:hypothetical protein
MSVKFRVQSGFNFQSNSYAIVFNTSGSGITPLPQTLNNNYAGYSMAIIVGGAGGTVTAQAFYYYRPASTAQLPVLYPIGATPQQLIFTPNSNGLGTEFTVIFSRNIANFNLAATPGPTSTATSVATATPTASGTVSPAPTTSGVAVADNWNFNFFVVSGSVVQGQSAGALTILDSLGTGGPTDNSYMSPTLNVSTPFDTTFLVIAGNHPSIPDALQGGEIANNP